MTIEQSNGQLVAFTSMTTYEAQRVFRNICSIKDFVAREKTGNKNWLIPSYQNFVCLTKNMTTAILLVTIQALRSWQKLRRFIITSFILDLSAHAQLSFMQHLYIKISSLLNNCHKGSPAGEFFKKLFQHVKKPSAQDLWSQENPEFASYLEREQMISKG